MKHILTAILSLLLTSFALLAIDHPKGFAMAEIHLGYLSQQAFAERVSVRDLADYTKRLQAVCSQFFAQTTIPEDLSIVVAVKPGKRSKVWFVSSRAPVSSERRDDLRAELEAVLPPVVHGGPIAFAIVGRIAGGQTKGETKAGPPPVPKEWRDAPSIEPGPLDQVLPRIWQTEPSLRESPTPPPDTGSASAQDYETPPTEFVTQTLEPTGGKILRPKDWFYTERHSGRSYVWILSREDASKGPWTTGVCIQALAFVQRFTGLTPRVFVLYAVAATRDKATKILSTCDEQDQGLFTRICLETEQGAYHNRYSMFWGDRQIDIVIISTSSTSKELWNTYAPIFDKMSAFEVIDMKRFEK
jgi:hypothetical protein